MNRLDRIYQKALCGAKNVRSQELLKQSSIYMPFWSNAMSYCYANKITIPKDDNALADVYRTALQACGYQPEEIQHFIEWYFDKDNDAVFVTIDYGNGDLMFGYPPVSMPDDPPKEKEKSHDPLKNENPDRDPADACQSLEYGIKRRN